MVAAAGRSTTGCQIQGRWLAGERGRLSVLFGGVPDRALVCAFVAGLPDSVRQVIRARSRAESLSLDDVLARVCSCPVLRYQRLTVDPLVAAAAQLAVDPVAAERLADPVAAAARLAIAVARARAPPAEERSQRPAAPEPRQRPPTATRGPRRCWIRGMIGHISVGCLSARRRKTAQERVHQRRRPLQDGRRGNSAGNAAASGRQGMQGDSGQRLHGELGVRTVLQ